MDVQYNSLYQYINVDGKKGQRSLHSNLVTNCEQKNQI